MGSLNLTRRRFLALGGAAGVLGVGATLGRQAVAQVSRSVSPTPSRGSVHARRGERRSVAGQRRVVDTPHRRRRDPYDTGIEQRPTRSSGRSPATRTSPTVERRGTTSAVPELGHSVHVVVDGLAPGREYWYRFRCGRWISADRANEDSAAARSAGQPTRHRRGVVSIVGRWLLHRPPAPRRRRARRRRLPRRLHLRTCRRRTRVWPATRDGAPRPPPRRDRHAARATERDTPGTSATPTCKQPITPPRGS